jgi:hypothetical protein
LLNPLFAQFATGADNDPDARLLGYLIALERATPQALMAAVRSYLCGEVEDHDGKFIPTSAKLARVVRKEQAHLNRVTFSEVPLQLVDAREPSEEEKRAEEKHRARMAAKFKALSERLGGGE